MLQRPMGIGFLGVAAMNNRILNVRGNFIAQGNLAKILTSVA
jgi:hypothetical protein